MDLGLYHAINGLAGLAGWSDALLKAMATDLPVAIGLIVAGAWFWGGVPIDRAERQRLAVYAVTAALLGLALAQDIGHVWFRERPYVHHAATLLLSPSADPSFPSDHAVGAFGLAVPFLLARRRIGWLLVGMATTLAVSRVAAGTHYPSDVLGGAGLGALSAVVVWRVRARLEAPLAPCLLLARRLHLA